MNVSDRAARLLADLRAAAPSDPAARWLLRLVERGEHASSDDQAAPPARKPARPRREGSHQRKKPASPPAQGD
jgi:hypothetical protein